MMNPYVSKKKVGDRKVEPLSLDRLQEISVPSELHKAYLTYQIAAKTVL